jgi:3-hydroxyacyl-[acyl-carrier-protein] dehydratase
MSRLQQAIVESAQECTRTPETGGVERTYRFAPEFLGFAGHFPGFPVLPALVQVLTAVSVAEALAGCPLGVETVENAKFLIQIAPGDPVTVFVKERLSGGKRTVDARLTVPKGLASSFRLSFADRAENS